METPAFKRPLTSDELLEKIREYAGTKKKHLEQLKHHIESFAHKKGFVPQTGIKDKTRALYQYVWNRRRGLKKQLKNFLTLHNGNDTEN